MKNLFSVLLIFCTSVFLAGCQIPSMDKFKEGSKTLFEFPQKVINEDKKLASESTNRVVPLQDIIDNSLATVSMGSSFEAAMKDALNADPQIMALRSNLEAKLASIEVIEASRKFQLSSSLYGGVEDLTDNKKGIALVLDASRPVYDGGAIDAQLAEKLFLAESARQKLRAKVDERALELGKVWIELEKHETQQFSIDSRLRVLDPLIKQLEEVAKAGIGDVSKVASAQRTVSEIRVIQTKITEGLAQARLSYLNSFGALPGDMRYDSDYISSLVPANISDLMIHNAPIIASRYATYQASSARVTALEAKDKFNVDLKMRASRPFAGSDTDSDESIGLVASKTIINGGLFAAEIKEAEAMIETSVSEVKAAYREGLSAVKNAQQNIASMQKAILLAQDNRKLISEEIAYLRQQLIIGGSTLGSVLSAEARLYAAESQEIEFVAEKRKSELIIISSLGLLSSSLKVVQSN
jgi:outer membrane protein TolC